MRKNKRTPKNQSQKTETSPEAAGAMDAGTEINAAQANDSSAGGHNGNQLQDKSFALKNAERNALLQLDKSYNTLVGLAAIRLDCKLSNSRVTGVARELKELIKVMSVYA